MGDSDEEYDRRRGRDKFRRERSDYQERRDDRSRGRDDWPERDSWNAREVRSRRDYRDYDVGSRRRERYSPTRHELSPPVKRMRRDWEDRGGYGGGGGGGGGFEGGFPPVVGGPHHGGGPWAGPGGPQDMGHVPHGGYGGHGAAAMAGGPSRFRDPEQGLTQPPMMTFKQFLSSQDDTIDDQEAVRKYNEYKMDFRRQQLNEFFVNHKEEEWFKSKYHPEECGKRKAEQAAGLSRRLDVFLRLQEAGWIDAVSIDVEKSDKIVRLLDAVVILLEGGTEFDLQVLDEPCTEEKPKDSDQFPPTGPKEEGLPAVKSVESENEGTAASPQRSEGTNHDDENAKGEDGEGEGGSKDKEKRQRKYSYSEDNSSSSSSSDSSDDDDDPDSGVPGEESGSETKSKKKKKKKVPAKEEEDKAEEESVKKGEEAPKDASMEDEEDEEEKEGGDDAEAKEEKSVASGGEEEQEEKEDRDAAEGKKEEEEEDEPLKPRPFHKTCSIFLRNLAPTITKVEVEAMCKRYPGFLRVAIADPQPERRFFRRGWVTFERTVNIKEICWNLNNIRLRDCELGAIVNRDLSRRIRSVNGIASHKTVVRSDIKLSARIIQNLDSQRGLWDGAGKDSNAKDDKEQVLMSFGGTSKNPLLKNITDYLIEEASAEEEELLGGVTDQEEQREADDAGATLDKDDTLIKVLDRLLLYLRVVHSVDYYNHSEYASEDEMPNRCGIMHARGSPPSSKVTPQEISDYISHFETKIASFLQPCTKLSTEEATRLGRKDPESEVEKFVTANTQELAKDKWLCPLSGKKFKGPEFVRKHIYNKHAEKVDEVRKEVAYFNNYLMDAKRPQLPEHPANRGGGMRGPDHGGMMAPFHGGFPPPPPFGFGRGHGPGFPGFGGRNFPDMYRGGFKRNNYGRRSPRGEPRKLVTYRDLDAPNDVDFA
ncbi:serrate RNA effector molecule homolog isoform X5 [Ornithodoros turicata]|uniref:serrate RNA effector molecule homolog isoform X5 n=1 Tax=Ornithodoros turicata TaxID=34597 RepID=UPI00313A4A0C